MAYKYDVGPRIGITGEPEFNRQVEAINDRLREWGSEMNSLSGKFADNANSQEALIAKMKVLQKQYDTQKQKSELYQKQYEKETKKLEDLAEAYQKAAKENGETSKEAIKAEIAYDNQNKTVSKLKVAINETEGYIGKLTNEIEKNQQAMNELETETQDAEKGLEDLADAAGNAGDELGQIGEKLDKDLLMDAAETLEGLADSLISAAEESKEFMKISGQLETSSANLGYTTKQTQETFRELYGILGDDQTAATTTANLQALGLSQEKLKQMTEGAIGAWAQYGDSIPIDGLAESINETAQAGQVTGTFADVLNWAGTSEDAFNDKLSKCSNTSQRAELILKELTEQGLLKSAEGFRENNKALIENNEANMKYQQAMAEMSENILPIMTMVKEAVATLVNAFNGLPEPVQTGAVAIGALAVGAAKVAPAFLAIKTAMTAATTAQAAMAAGSTAAAAGTTAAGTAAGGAAIGFGALNTSLLPIIAVIAAVAAAIAAVVLVIKNWDDITQWFKDRWESAMKKVGEVTEGVEDSVKNAREKVRSHLTGMKDDAVEKFSEMKEKAGNQMEEMKKNLENTASGMEEKLTEKVNNVRKSYEDAGGGIEGAMSAAFTAMHEIATAKMDAIDVLTGGKLTKIAESFQSKMESAKTSFFNSLDEMKSRAAAKVEAIKTAMDSGVEKLKKVFDFEWKLPKIKMPHFTVSGKFSLSPPSAPKFSVSWYKTGAILQGAQIFGMQGDRFLGGGESGAEAVLPLSSFYAELEAILRNAMGQTTRDYSGSMKINYAPAVTVQVGNKEFDAYIVKTADKGISNKLQSGSRAKGRI